MNAVPRGWSTLGNVSDQKPVGQAAWPLVAVAMRKKRGKTEIFSIGAIKAAFYWQKASNSGQKAILEETQAGSQPQCFNELRGATEGETMVSTIIFLLAIITAGLVAGVFIVALIELNEIDEISRHSSETAG